MGKDTKTKEIVRIDLDDVRSFGSIENAIAGVCVNSEILVADSSAMGGQTFATSGPGPGWTQQFNSGDYAHAAIQQDIAESGCAPSSSSVINPSDGRIGHGMDNDEEDEEEDWSGKIQWEDESSVCVDCPSIKDAVEKPAIVAEMARAAIEIHCDHSNLKEWEELVTAIRKAADKFSDIDFD